MLAPFVDSSGMLRLQIRARFITSTNPGEGRVEGKKAEFSDLQKRRNKEAPATGRRFLGPPRGDSDRANLVSLRTPRTLGGVELHALSLI